MRVVLLILLSFSVAFLCLLDRVGLAEIPIFIGIGWIKFLWRVVPEMQVDGRGVVTALVCITALIGGSHWFFSWLHKARTKLSEQGTVPHWSWRRTFALLSVVVLMFVAGIAAVGVTHQTVWLISSPQPLYDRDNRYGARSVSANNLRQMALACHFYVGEKGDLPPGVLLDREGTPLHGWQTLLLPAIEQDNLYQRIDLRLPWNHPDNASACRAPVKTYLNPLADPDEANGFALSHYAANVHMIGGDVSRSLKSKAVLERGAENTILFGEVAEDFRPWSYPMNWRDPSQGINRGPNSFGNPTRKYVQFGMADGSARVFTNDADPDFLKALSNAAPPRRDAPQGVALAPGW